MKNNFKDLTGEVFGRLTVLEETSERRGTAVVWLCQCSCGNTTKTVTTRLKSGNTSSCGCLRDELSSKRAKEISTKHGWSRTKVYRALQDAKARCYNPEHAEFIRYGAIGIKISNEFLNSPEAWCEYLGNPPDNVQKWSVDRIDAYGNYERGNLRWSLPDKQTRNQKKQSNNTSGVTGVTWYTTGNNHTYAIAWYNKLDGKTGSKSFSVRKYGLLESFAMACLYREKMIAELNEQGAGYSINHGK